MKKARMGLSIVLVFLIASCVFFFVRINKERRSPFLSGSKPECVTGFKDVFCPQKMIPEDFVEFTGKSGVKSIYGVIGDKLISYPVRERSLALESYNVIYSYGETNSYEPHKFTCTYPVTGRKIIVRNGKIYFILNSRESGAFFEFDIASRKTKQLLKASTHMNSISTDGNNIIVAADKILFVSHNAGKSFLKINSENYSSYFPNSNYVFQSLLQGRLFSYFDRKSGYLCLFDLPSFGNYFAVSNDFLKNNIKIIAFDKSAPLSEYAISGINIFQDKDNLKFVIFGEPFGSSLCPDYKFRKPFIVKGGIKANKIYIMRDVGNLSKVQIISLPEEVHQINCSLRYKKYILLATDRGIWAFDPYGKLGKLYKAPFVYGNINKMVIYGGNCLIFSETDINSPGLFYFPLLH